MTASVNVSKERERERWSEGTGQAASKMET